MLNSALWPLRKPVNGSPVSMEICFVQATSAALCFCTPIVWNTFPKIKLEERNIWQILALERLETCIHSIFLACLILTGLCKWFLPTPGCQSDKTIYQDLIFFSYNETVIPIAQLRLKLASITSLIYNSHQPLVPKTSHSLWNFTCHISCRVKCFYGG